MLMEFLKNIINKLRHVKSPLDYQKIIFIESRDLDNHMNTMKN